MSALATAGILLLWILVAGSRAGASGTVSLAAYLAGGGLLGSGAFLLSAHLLGVQEPAVFWQRVCALRQTKRGRSGGYE